MLLPLKSFFASSPLLRRAKKEVEIEERARERGEPSLIKFLGKKGAEGGEWPWKEEGPGGGVCVAALRLFGTVRHYS